MASPETEKPGVERGEGTEKLKVSRAEIRRASKTEREAAEADLTKRGAEAEKAINSEREKSRESEAVLSKETSTKETKKDAEPKSGPRLRPKPHTKAERTQVYKKEIKQVQGQMSGVSRTFSKVIHNSAVERVSDVAEKSVMRPSALIGGAILGLGLGLIVYIISRINHYEISGLEILVLFIAGALVGVIVEYIIKRVRS